MADLIGALRDNAIARWIVAFVLLVATDATAAPSRLTVLYFDNNTGDRKYDPLSKGLADMMITDLATAPGLVVVEREKLESLIGELKLQRSKYFDPSTAQRIGKGIGAAYAVTGALTSLEPQIRIDVRVIKIDTAAVVRASTVVGRKDDFFALWQKLSAQLVEGLAAVLPEADAEKARAAARANRVDDLDTVLEYARGLDARDQGDLDAASRHLQRVVNESPSFSLGKDRYRQIMKELYGAKDRRASLLGDSEKRLLASVERELHGGGKPRLAYRVVLGQYHLTKVAAAVNAGKPAAVYREHVRRFVDNQLQLFAETRELSTYEGFGASAELDAEDERLAREIGIQMPGNTFGWFTPAGVLRDLNQFLMSNEPSIHQVDMAHDKAACFYTLYADYPGIVIEAYGKALDHIDRYEGNYRERETMRTLREYAEALARLGHPEQAIAKLQSGLDRFPKSDEFSEAEALLREILAGKVPHAWCPGK